MELVSKEVLNFDISQLSEGDILDELSVIRRVKSSAGQIDPDTLLVRAELKTALQNIRTQQVTETKQGVQEDVTALLLSA